MLDDCKARIFFLDDWSDACGLPDEGRRSISSAELVDPNIDTQSLCHVQICDGVIDLIAELFGIEGRELRAPNRSSRSVARVRQIGMYVANTTLNLSMARVAEGFRRDRSTVVHACHLIEDMRDDPTFDHVLIRVEAVIRIAFRCPAFPIQDCIRNPIDTNNCKDGGNDSG